MEEQSLLALQSNHLAIWKSKNPAERLELMAGTYAENIRMFDKDFTLTGHAEISKFIDQLHSSDNHFDFAAAKPIEATQHGARFYWTIGTKDPGKPLTGMDFFIVEDLLVTQLFVFIDRP